MSFTEDELQAFNTVLERRFSAHRQEMEQLFDQRLDALRQGFEQRLLATQYEIVRGVDSRFIEQLTELSTALSQKLITQQTGIAQSVNQRIGQQREQFEGLVDRTVKTQLVAIEKLLKQYPPPPQADKTSTEDIERSPRFEVMEVQTDLLWEEMMEIFGKVLDERFLALEESMQQTMRGWESALSVRLHTLREELAQRLPQPSNGNITSMQDVFNSIEQLERVIESMQVAMTANHALLSNRLYQHLQLPLERAHAGKQSLANTYKAPPNGVSSSPSLVGEASEQ